MALLTVQSLCVHYGTVQAVKGVDFTVNRGEIVGLLGANGAGKSSTLNAIVGLVPTTSGTVRLDGENITHFPSEKLVKKGITLSPEGRRIFATLTVYDNIKMGAYGIVDTAAMAQSFDRVYNLFPILYERQHQYAGTLSGGQQQMLAVARALMSQPKVLLLDEPSLGLAPLIVQQIFDLIQTLCDQGVTMVLVEQNATKTLAIADRAYLFSNGEIIASGTGQELQQSDMIVNTYFGV